MIAALVLFSLMDSIANRLADLTHPFQAVWARFSFHALMSFLFLAPKLLEHLKTPYFGAQILRSTFLFIGTISFFVALHHLPLPEATAIFEISPILITLGAFIFLGEVIGLWRWLGVIIGFLGVLIIIRPGFESFTWQSLLPCLTALAYASYALSTRALGKNESPWTSFLYTALVGFLLSSTLIPFFWHQPNLEAWILMVLLGFVAGFAHYMFIHALSLAEISFLAPLSYLSVPLSILWGALFFREYIDALTLLGAALIIGSGIFIWWRERLAHSRSSRPIK